MVSVVTFPAAERHRPSVLVLTKVRSVVLTVHPLMRGLSK